MAWAAPTDLADAATCELHFQITPHHDASPRVLEVSLEFPAGGRTETYLRGQPEWAGVKNFANDLTHWHGLSTNTVVEATDQPFRLRVSHPPTGRVRVQFEARGGLAEPDNGQPQGDRAQQYRTQIGADWFQFFGYGVMPSVEPYGDDRQIDMCVTIAQPDVANATVLGSYFDGHGESVSSHLFGSPYLLRHAFYAGGLGWRVSEKPLTNGTIGVAMRGHFEADDAGFVAKAASLIDTQRRFWGDTNSAKQWVVITPNYTPYNFGGTLVQNVAMLFANKSFRPASPGFDSLIGHENLHQWIPQRLGAHGGDPAHYWFSEGFTDYYTHRLLLSSGNWSLPQYADALTRQLRRYWQSPARNATAASIAPRFFTDDDAGKQMYSRGEILALRWDAALRSAGHAGIDNILRGMLLPEGSQPTEPAHARVLAALAPMFGGGPRQDVQQFIVEGHELPLPADLLGPCFELSRADVPHWTLGFDLASTTARKMTGVVLGGPAYNAGVRDGMPLSSWSIFFGDFQKEVSLTVVAEGQPLTINYSPVDGTRDSLPMVTVSPLASRAAACEAWVHRAV